MARLPKQAFRKSFLQRNSLGIWAGDGGTYALISDRTHQLHQRRGRASATRWSAAATASCRQVICGLGERDECAFGNVTLA
jgi:hypothetical protein